MNNDGIVSSSPCSKLNEKPGCSNSLNITPIKRSLEIEPSETTVLHLRTKKIKT